MSRKFLDQKLENLLELQKFHNENKPESVNFDNVELPELAKNRPPKLWAYSGQKSVNFDDIDFPEMGTNPNPKLRIKTMWQKRGKAPKKNRATGEIDFPPGYLDTSYWAYLGLFVKIALAEKYLRIEEI